MKNPFRTKRIIIAGVETNIFITVPFFGKIKMYQRKASNKIRGRKVKMIVVDEAQYMEELKDD